jgi:hypothetical protein
VGLVAIAIVFGGVVLAGCGGKSGGSPTAAAGTSAAATPTATASAGSDEIKAIAAKLSAATFKGTYTLTTSGTSTDAITGGQMVLYKQADKRIRFDVSGQQGGQDVQIVVIESGDKSLFCLKDPGGVSGITGVPSGEGVCVNSSPNDANPTGSLNQIFSDLQNADVTVLEKSSRTVAGIAGDCYRSKDNQTGEISTLCFSSDGAVLYAQNEGDAASEIVATQITGAVADTDFDPPYPITDIPGLGSQG